MIEHPSYDFIALHRLLSAFSIRLSPRWQDSIWYRARVHSGSDLSKVKELVRAKGVAKTDANGES